MILTDYRKFLLEEIFEVSKNGQFKLMFDLFDKLNTRPPMKVCILERSYIYGGHSIFSPLFNNHDVVTVDYRPITAGERAGFQASWINDVAPNLPVSEGSISDSEFGLKFNIRSFDFECLIIPNILHHCRNFGDLMAEFLRRHSRINEIHIFDSYFREQHQYPDDYCRYTVPAIENVLDPLSFKISDAGEYGNVFDGLLYLIRQSEPLLNVHPELEDIRKKLLELTDVLPHFAEQEKYRGLERPFASFATSYYASFKKNEK